MVQAPASSNEDVVLVIEDDEMLRQALVRLFRSVGLRAVVHGSAAEFLGSALPDAPCCLLLDVRLPGVSGLDLQEELARRQIGIPIVFMTGHGDIPMSVEAMKAGAVDFLTKPFRDQDMLHAVTKAIARDRERREHERSQAGLRARFAALTPREQEIMTLVTRGLMNKQVAGEVGLSEITVKIHRGNVMRKMAAKTLADLVRMADYLGLGRAKP
jgi:FixJ family two-component response regulator